MRNSVITTCRDLELADAESISAAFARQGWDKPTSQYCMYFEQTQTGQREVILAFVENDFAGYLTIVWASDYPPFKAAGIPEIVDFNVLEKFQRQGVGSLLMDNAETRIQARSARAGIGVGLMVDYGKAQILYAKRGYVPDGRGIFRAGRWLQTGDPVNIDHDVILYFTKELNPMTEHLHPIDTHHGYDLHLPRQAPSGALVELINITTKGNQRVHGFTADEREIYFEVRSYAGHLDHAQAIAEQQQFLREHSPEGDIGPTEATQVLGIPAQEFRFDGLLHGRHKVRRFIFFDTPARTFRLVYDPRSPVNEEILASLKVAE